MKKLILLMFILSLFGNFTYSQEWRFTTKIKEAQKTKANKIKTLKIFDNYNSKKSLIFYYEYNQNGNETTFKTYNDASVSDDNRYYYDSQNRLINSESLNDHSEVILIIQYEYNGLDIYPYKETRIKDGTTEETFFYYSNNRILYYISDNIEYRFEYDDQNRIITVPQYKYKIYYNYLNNKIIETNTLQLAMYRTREKIYNESGLLTEIRLYDNDKQLISLWAYTYDNNGNIIYEDIGRNENPTTRREYEYEYYEEQSLIAEGQPSYDEALKAFNQGKYTLVIDLLKDFPESSSLYDDALALMLKALGNIQSGSSQNFATVYGKINCSCQSGISGYVIFEDLISGSQVGKCRIGSNGYYCIVLPSGKRYSYYIDAAGFYPLSRIADFSSPAQASNLNDNITLVSLEEMTEQQVSIRINNIFFDFNESTLKSESFLELDRLYNVLNTNSDIKVEISGHTDNVGSDDYNNKLSQSRANSVKDYLVKKGINSSRIISKGYGKSSPVATNDTEDGRQLNRRVEFKILKK